jgi:hypothetical protein
MRQVYRSVDHHARGEDMPDTLHPTTAEAATDQVDPHGDVACADVEAMLAEAVADADAAREEVAMLRAADAARQADMDAVREEVTRVRALLAEYREAAGRSLAFDGDLESQVEMVLGELAAAEAVAVPAGTVVLGTLRRADVTAAYRAESRVTRGTVPPSVVEAVQEAQEEIAEAMIVAGRAAARRVVAAEVAHRSATGRSGRGLSHAA